MNPIDNPFAPGSGAPPPELAGRDALLEQIHVAVERTRLRRSARSLMLIGLRGVGKTVLLVEAADRARANGAEIVRFEPPEGQSLPSLLAPQLRVALLRLSRNERAKDRSVRALRALAGFAQSLKVRFGDIEVGLDFDPEPGLADNGNLEQDLLALLTAAGEAASDAEKVLLLIIDELQYVREDELAALTMAMHGASQTGLPVILLGAGLPQLRGQLGKARSYAERLFEYIEVGPLAPEAAEAAIRKPLNAHGIGIEAAALAKILAVTHCYPYFLQEWGKHAWDVARTETIRAADVEQASVAAVAALDSGFFRVRLDRLSPSERRYLRAMAELGPGPHRSGDISSVLRRKVTSLAPTRAKLIEKGMVWSPSHGDTAFTVPLFDEFVRRIMPEFPD